MNRVNFVLWAALLAALLSATAMAQGRTPNYANPQTEQATYYPAQTTARLLDVGWGNRYRCDGDHDRDDRHCHWRASGYAPGGPNVVANGWYDARGRWHPAGWYDRYGRWHAYLRW